MIDCQRDVVGRQSFSKLTITIVINIGTLPAQPAPTSVPIIDIVYPAPTGSIFDVNCGRLLKVTIKPEFIQEAVRRAPELQSAWGREGRQYLTTTFVEIGLAFPYKEMQATLTVCPGVTTMSNPLFINVENYLPSAAERFPDEHFVEQLYHELMHQYVHQVREVSTLRKKYANEGTATLSHLHVIALEKLVLSKLGKTEELTRVAHDYQTSPSPQYRRAWQIVSDDGYEPYVNELKQLAQSRK